jgi:diguanylate cyclase (GGDEF)-like protein/PAS domain S-box-containing protein
MKDDSLFLGLKWKLAILLGCFLLILLSAFSYYSYLNAKANFEQDRDTIERSHIKLLDTLTKDSFLVLEQFGELLSAIHSPDQAKPDDLNGALLAVDDKWARWQVIWDIENITFYNNQGNVIKSWGNLVASISHEVTNVIKTEIPDNRVVCPSDCYQRVVIPLLGKTDNAGAIAIIRSFSDVIIKYNNATGVDVGILTADKSVAIAPNSKQANSGWSYRLSGLTDLKNNAAFYKHLTQNYDMTALSQSRQRIQYDSMIYEVRLTPVKQAESGQSPPYFIFIDNITADLQQLTADLKRIWLFSIIGLLLALGLILMALHLFFRRITRLSQALPLLAKKQFIDFRQFIPVIDRGTIGSDEIDILSQSALILADHLESLEQEMHTHTFNLLEKSQELAKERDFVKQLIDLAPIIIIIQKLNGIILSINRAGIEGLETSTDIIIGKVFDIFIPEADQEHVSKINHLRNGEFGDQVQLDGHVLTESGRIRDISWLHKVLSLKEYGSEMVILSLGIDISERKVAEARNIRMAYYDYLTGLGNRRKFHEEFAQKLASAERYNYQLALLYMDLDRFKEINDTSGHEVGDNFLKLVANTLKAAIRTTDLLCRLGGDEFTLLMPHADIEGIEHIATKVNAVLRVQTFTCAGKSFTPSASIGVAVYPIHGLTVNELMANADLAMYRAKELGRGQYHLFDNAYDYRSKSNQMVYWRKILEDSIANDKFILFYQPILTIKSNEIGHYECLVRLQGDDGQLILPNEFVYRAEELGLISKIDRIVLKKAIHQHIEFNRQGKDHKLSVNISRRTFDDPSIFDDFSVLFANPEVDKDRIIFEITDTAAVSNFETTNTLINQIKGLGCILALNDFGMEYPSLHYLKNAPVDYVKIDGSLIRQLDKNEDDRIFVKALTEVAQAFGKKTVAEYVENEAVLAILRDFGIDYAQGYFIGKPDNLP